MLSSTSAILLMLAAGSAWGQVPGTASAPADRAGEIADLGRQLGSDDSRTREQAEKRLIEIGPPAVEALTALTKSQDPEVCLRAERALKAIGQAAALAARMWKTPVKGVLAGGPILVGDRIVFAAGNGAVSAVEAKTGTVAWSDPKCASTDTRMAQGDGLVFVCTADGLRALDAATGRQKWLWKDAQPRTPPACAAGLVFVGAWSQASGTLVALEPADGKVAWSKGMRGLYRPVAADGWVVHQDSRRLILREARTGQEKWTANLPGSVSAGPAIGDETVYVALGSSREAGKFMAYLVSDGAKQWECDLSRPADPMRLSAVPRPAWGQPDYRDVGSIVLADGAAFFCRSGSVYCVDIAGRKERWLCRPFDDSDAPPPAGGGPVVMRLWAYEGQGEPTDPAVVGETVLVCDRAGLRALDARTGLEAWRFATDEAAVRRPLVVGRVAVFGTVPTQERTMSVTTSALPGGRTSYRVQMTGAPPVEHVESGLYAVDLSKVPAPATRPARP